jgi:ectoine hydroxylase-related dioxygenase (phytanoyl-CoA dioxygenase family)
MINHSLQTELKENGFGIQQDLYTFEEVESILRMLHQSPHFQKNFNSGQPPFAIRQLLKQIPELTDLLFNTNIKTLLSKIWGNDFFMVKSIYFNKPEASNWLVPWHQDLTISVDKKIELENYTHWTVKNDQYSVQPPIEILENMYTLRIHLDAADENNGALMVVPGSHKNGIIRVEDMDWDQVPTNLCRVPRGGVMFMRPLLFHASARTTNNHQRRVIHVEFCNQELAKELVWAEMPKNRGHVFE